jgi:hypothetical protein
MVLVAEDSDVGGNNFIIKVPSSYGYFERGWATYKYAINNFTLDGITNPNTVYNANYQKYGTITASQLLPDVDHDVVVAGYGVLIIVYRE